VAPLGIGVIGLGRHGMRYVQHLLEPLPETRLVAVCRRNAAQGRAVATEHALRFYQDYRELIADTAVQAVVVVTPPSLAHPICLDAIRGGKAVLVEKPLACTGAEARDLVRAAGSARVPLMTAQTLRFDQAVLAFKEQLATVGAPRYLVLTNRIEPRPGIWKDPTDYGGRGVLLEIGIHLLDLVRFLTGQEVAEVRCEMERPAPDKPELRALVSLRTVGNLPCVLDVSRMGAGRMSRAEWIAEDGQMIVDWTRHSLCKVSSHNLWEAWTVPTRPTVAATLSAFAHALERGASMPITGEDGQKAVEVADACYESAETGCSVRVVP
jgi:predicted dehydrogenase